MSPSYPDLPSIDVRRAYLAWCAPSPWLLALALASTTAWMLASPHVLAPLLAGFGATALLWFRSDGPGHASRLGSPASLALIGLTIWLETKPTAAGPTLHRTLVLATLAWAANEEAQAMERQR